MTKEEKIQEAWVIEQLHEESEGVPNYNEDGWAKYGRKQNSNYFKQLEEKEWLGYWFYRPTSLDGIEENSGWIKIESESDLPEQGGSYYVTRHAKVETAVYVKDNRWLIKGNDYPKTTSLHSISHYQPIIKPELPIY